MRQSGLIQKGGNYKFSVTLRDETLYVHWLVGIGDFCCETCEISFERVICERKHLRVKIEGSLKLSCEKLLSFN